MAALKPTNRFRLEVIGAGISFVVGVLTMLMPNWVEALFGADPDHGDGSLERHIVVACASAAVLLGMLAWVDYRRSTAG